MSWVWKLPTVFLDILIALFVNSRDEKVAPWPLLARKLQRKKPTVVQENSGDEPWILDAPEGGFETVLDVSIMKTSKKNMKYFAGELQLKFMHKTNQNERKIISYEAYGIYADCTSSAKSNTVQSTKK